LDPNLSSRAFAAASDGVYKITGLPGPPMVTATKLTTGKPPPHAYQLTALNEGGTTELFAASAPAAFGTSTDGGLYRFVPGVGGTWVYLSSGPPTGFDPKSSWGALDAAWDGTNATVYLGATYMANPSTCTGGGKDPSQAYDSEWKAVVAPGGSTVAWTALVGPDATGATVNTTIGGPEGTPWWLIANPSTCAAPARGTHPEETLGHDDYSASQLVVDPNPPTGKTRLYLAGRSGAWRGLCCNTGGAFDWYPVVNGLQNVSDRAVAADPSDANFARVADSDKDWTLLTSQSHELNAGPVLQEPSLCRTTPWRSTPTTAPAPPRSCSSGSTPRAH
jgi:hypothetical protein